MKAERIISIQALEVMAKVGVPDEERAAPQRLLLDLRFASLTQPEHLNDDITLTVDYAALSQRIQEIVLERPRKLIETLADELAEQLQKEFSLRWVELTIRKFILPQTEWVAVSIRLEAK
jgi:dihydroneopterin aldolase